MKNPNFIFLLLTVVSFACKDNITNPIEILPGRTDYVWTYDTLNVGEGNSLSRIWASSDNNVWACGEEELWHYNGISWSKNGSVPGYSYGALSGTDESNVWMIANGNYSGIDAYHYNGSSWSKYAHYAYSQVGDGMWLDDLWGDSQNGLIGVGAFETTGGTKNTGIIMKLVNNNWTFATIPEIDATFDFVQRDILGNGNYYICGEQILRDTTTNPITINGFVYKIYEYDGANIKEIFSRRGYYIWPETIGGHICFIGQNTLQIYQNGSFQVVKDFSSSGYNIDNGYGRTEKDIILYGVKGTDYSGTKYVVHYNGTDFTLLLTTINQIGATVITNNSVFIVTETKEYKWIIIKGTLKS